MLCHVHVLVGELLSVLRTRLGVLLDVNEDDLKLYPYMSEEKKQAYYVQCEVRSGGTISCWSEHEERWLSWHVSYLAHVMSCAHVAILAIGT